MTKLPKFEIELPAAPKSTKLSLSERDIAMATMYVCLLRDFLLSLLLVMQLLEMRYRVSGSLGPRRTSLPC